MIGIYKIENKANGKVYIGQSANINKRWIEHRSNLNNNRHPNRKLQNAWNNYGQDNFDFNILEVF
jgi:group I intron endonuclease